MKKTERCDPVTTHSIAITSLYETRWQSVNMLCMIIHLYK